MQIRLGDILVAAGLLQPEELDLALKRQRETGARLGQVVLAMGLVTEYDLYSTLAQQLGVPFLSNPVEEVDPGVAVLVTEEMARRHRAAPVRLEQDHLLVVTAEPLNYLALEDLSLQSGREIKVAVASEQVVQAVLFRLYGAGVDHRDGNDGAIRRAFDLEDAAEGPVKVVNQLLIQALSQRATDLHIDPASGYGRVRYRVDGILQDGPRVPGSVMPSVLSRIKVMAGMDIAERRRPQDGRIEVELQGRRLDLRVGTVPTVLGEKASIRILDRSASQLALPDLHLAQDVFMQLKAILSRPYGLLLVTGPTGSGKTTTLLAALAELDGSTRQILTVEDPVEYYVPGVNQVQVNTQAGLTFATGLRAFLRQDPDVLMVGEIRDGETADIAVRAALTGHLVLSTLHTNLAAGTPERLADMGVEPYLVSSALSAVLSQRLVRKLCIRCRRPVTVTPDHPDFALLSSFGLAGQIVYEPEGCPACEGQGYRGRVALAELLVVTDPIRRLIHERASAAQLAAVAQQEGMRTLFADGIRQVVIGSTSLSEVKRASLVEG